ncbi:ef hand domain-containing, partial [Cystoisospora suis]
MRREKSDAQSKNALLQERLRQADQDKAIQFASIDGLRSQTWSVRDERLRLMEKKQNLLANLNQTAQQTVLRLQNSFPSTPPLALASPTLGGISSSSSSAGGGGVTAVMVRRDSKGVRAGGGGLDGSNLKILTGRAGEEEEREEEEEEELRGRARNGFLHTSLRSTRYPALVDAVTAPKGSHDLSRSMRDVSSSSSLGLPPTSNSLAQWKVFSSVPSSSSF